MSCIVDILPYVERNYFSSSLRKFKFKRATLKSYVAPKDWQTITEGDGVQNLQQDGLTFGKVVHWAWPTSSSGLLLYNLWNNPTFNKTV